jgi:hypothetical protein
MDLQRLKSVHFYPDIKYQRRTYRLISAATRGVVQVRAKVEVDSVVVTADVPGNGVRPADLRSGPSQAITLPPPSAIGILRGGKGHTEST